ncbi:hypothetical protein [Roseospira visakhapatnamensis]|uniref:Putative coiled-coil protein SlyX n=1 Tax=Roseospira visakhapatnamensis TaxID=390880 RepID=A0A7W6W854_9PROT|nr:hypothetical protein [Roseospira visakhapatnamensis]MBB4264635.1 putative coiled-coil protein SlyX [Roseospira visakhapatnamensis]
METRVTRLETEFTYVRRDLDEIKAALTDLRVGQDSIREDVASLKAQLAEKPSRGFVIGTVIAIFGLCAGMVGATVTTLQYLQGTL